MMILEDCTRTAAVDIPNYARAIDVLENADKVVLAMGQPPYNDHDEASIRDLLSLPYNKRRVSRNVLKSGDPLPTLSKILNTVRTYSNPNTLADFINVCLSKRSEGYEGVAPEDYKSFAVTLENAHKYVIISPV